MPRTRLPLLVAVVVATMLAGCGGSSTIAGVTSAVVASTRADRGMVQFARCMRAHGVAVPDPFHRSGHSGLSLDLPEQGPATGGAYKACGQFLAPVVQLKQRATAQRITPAMRLGLIHYAECMRTHAVPMLDPDALGQLNLGNVPGIGNGFGRYTPQFHLADHECRHLLPAGISDNGTGP